MKRKLLLLVLVFIIIVCMFNFKNEDFVDVASVVSTPIYNISKCVIDYGNNPDYIQVAQIAIYDENGVNIAPTATISSIDNTYYDDAGNVTSPAKAIDGTLAPRKFPDIYHSKTNTNKEYLKLVFPKPVSVSRITYYNRSDCCSNRAATMYIQLFDTYGNPVWTTQLTDDLIQDYDVYSEKWYDKNSVKSDYAPNGIRYVRIKPRKDKPDYINFSQLALYDETGKNVAPSGIAMCRNDSHPQTSVSKGIDGVDDTQRSFPNITHCGTNKSTDYFEVDLKKPYKLRKMLYINRGDCCKERADYMTIDLYDGNHVWSDFWRLSDSNWQEWDNLRYPQLVKQEDPNAHYKFDNGNFAAFKTIGDRPLSFWPFF